MKPRPLIVEPGRFVEGYFNNKDNEYPQYPLFKAGFGMPKKFLKGLKSLEDKSVEVDLKRPIKCGVCGKDLGSCEYRFKSWSWHEGLMHYLIEHGYEVSTHFERFISSKGRYRPRTRWGFTGSRSFTNTKLAYEILSSLKLKKGDSVLTGACVGADSVISKVVAKYWPEVYLVAIVPGNRTQVDKDIPKIANLIYEMPEESDYRSRNEILVRVSHYMVALWNGYKKSGTYMTMNIAKSYDKLYRTFYHSGEQLKIRKGA